MGAANSAEPGVAMSAAAEYLPATGRPLQDMVLLHGWGGNREMWRPLLASLRPWANVTLLDVPGCAPGPDAALPSLDAVLEYISARAPQRAVYLGFSLGGQLAMELASRVPERVLAIATLCSNPRFVADEASGWPGMPATEFSAFRSALETGPSRALKRFDSLQAQGALQPRETLRALAALGRSAPGPALAAGLAWLEQLDQRQQLAGLSQPQLHLLADADALVPVALAPALRHLLGVDSARRVGRIGTPGHLAPLAAPGQVAEQVKDFLADNALLAPPGPTPAEIPKASVAASFSRAASAYDSVAHLQREVGRELLQRLDELRVDPDTVLDLGCGTGFFSGPLANRFPQARHVGLDLAEGMVTYARQRKQQTMGQDGAGVWLVGDAEALPLASASIDLVFSSLALQWCYNLPLLMAEISRVLAPGGMCVFTSLGPGTLAELRDSWAEVDAHQHVNTFLPAADLAAAAEATPGIDLRLDSVEHRLRYERVRDLLDELRALGAHNMNSDRPAGLTGRAALQGMLRAYESRRVDGVLPATYEVYFGVIEKPTPERP
jgi:malonyl-CoA O-methyltransferase